MCCSDKHTININRLPILTFVRSVSLLGAQELCFHNRKLRLSLDSHFIYLFTDGSSIFTRDYQQKKLHAIKTLRQDHVKRRIL